jgi:pimeloyl-ACP methyl ester carboxylesterase
MTPRAALLATLALAACQSSFVYFPTRGLEGTPADSGLAYDDVHLAAADGVRIHGWYVHTPEPAPKAVILLCHGNGGNLYNWLGLAEVFAELGFDVFLFDYRGYGDSEGSPDEEGTYLDADAAWSHLVSERKIPAARIVIYGRSLGGAVASHLAAAHAPGGLIVDSSFTTIREFAMEKYPRLLVRLGLTYEYDNVANLGKIRCPVLVIHGRDDELVPLRHGEAIFAAANEPKRFLALDGGHNDNYLVDAARFRQGIADFVAACVPPPARSGR